MLQTLKSPARLQGDSSRALIMISHWNALHSKNPWKGHRDSGTASQYEWEPCLQVTVAQFANVFAQVSYGTMGILFACVAQANFSGRERRYSSTVLPACCVEACDVTAIPYVHVTVQLHMLEWFSQQPLISYGKHLSVTSYIFLETEVPW